LLLIMITPSLVDYLGIFDFMK